MSTTLLTGWRRSIWHGAPPESLNEIIPTGGRGFVCAMLPCSVTNQIQGHSDEGRNHLNTHFTAVPFFLSLNFSRNPLDTNKQDANKQTGGQTMHAHTSCAYQRPDMTEWVRRCVPAVLSPGKRSQDKLDRGSWEPDPVEATVYRRGPHTAAPAKAKMSCTVNRCHIKQLGKCHIF